MLATIQWNRYYHVQYMIYVRIMQSCNISVQFFASSSSSSYSSPCSAPWNKIRWHCGICFGTWLMSLASTDSEPLSVARVASHGCHTVLSEWIMYGVGVTMREMVADLRRFNWKFAARGLATVVRAPVHCTPMYFCWLGEKRIAIAIVRGISSLSYPSRGKVG